MALSMGQWAVSGTVPIFQVPPGPCAVTMYVATATLYLGLSKAGLTASNGFAVPTSPATFTAFNPGAGVRCTG